MVDLNGWELSSPVGSAFRLVFKFKHISNIISSTQMCNCKSTLKYFPAWDDSALHLTGVRHRKHLWNKKERVSALKRSHFYVSLLIAVTQLSLAKYVSRGHHHSWNVFRTWKLFLGPVILPLEFLNRAEWFYIHFPSLCVGFEQCLNVTRLSAGKHLPIGLRALVTLGFTLGFQV